jgi:hypothetical protein
MHRSIEDVLALVRVGSGILAGIAAFGSCGYLMMQMHVLAEAWASGTYRPAEFTVEWAVLDEEGGYYAVGTVDGKRERLGLHGVVPRPARQEDLDKAIPGGQPIRVGYAPTASVTTFNGASLRLVPWQDGLPWTLREKALGVLMRAYAPLLLLAGISVATSLAIRRPWAPPLSLVFFFLFFQVVAFGIIFAVELSERAR